MIICNCFEGDRMEIALAQHDLYFGKERHASYLPNGADTLGYWWGLATARAEWLARNDGEPWYRSNYRRMKRVERFSHKTLQIPHEHIAAYYRWIMRHTGPLPFGGKSKEDLRVYWLGEWGNYLRFELLDLVNTPAILKALCRTMLYRHFEAADRSAAELDRLLIERYGMECVAQTWRTDPKICHLMGVAA